jgi:hypothetical protein
MLDEWWKDYCQSEVPLQSRVPQAVVELLGLGMLDEWRKDCHQLDLP